MLKQGRQPYMGMCTASQHWGGGGGGGGVQIPSFDLVICQLSENKTLSLLGF